MSLEDEHKRQFRWRDWHTVLRAWATNLKLGGWIAVTEIDDLFGHEPLRFQTKQLFKAYGEKAQPDDTIFLCAANYEVTWRRAVSQFRRC
jgi:hypothetical protein